MLIEVDRQTFKSYFPGDPHPFISEGFIELNREKADSLIRLVWMTEKPVLGLVAAIRNGMMLSPFSAPFGGFHFRNEVVYASEIDSFLAALKDYTVKNNLKGFEITLPPDLYHHTINAKFVNSLVRNGYLQAVPEITNWVDLTRFSGVFHQKNSREYYRQSVRNGLTFTRSDNEDDKRAVYDLIRNNREKFGRPIFMNLADLDNTSSLWSIDYFKVCTAEGILVASAIFYQFHKDICYAVFWGDNEEGRPLRAMDFIAFNLWTYYKNLGYKFIDLGISTESGKPNDGLLRFKESHESDSSLRFRFYWHN